MKEILVGLPILALVLLGFIALAALCDRHTRVMMVISITIFVIGASALLGAIVLGTIHG